MTDHLTPAPPPSDGDRRPCVFAHCKGSMVYARSRRMPGNQVPTRLSDGTFKQVGLARPGWICDQNPNHMQTEGISGSEVVRSGM